MIAEREPQAPEASGRVAGLAGVVAGVAVAVMGIARVVELAGRGSRFPGVRVVVRHSA